MEILKAWGHNGSVEAGLVSGKGLHIPKVSEELASIDELKYQIEVSGILGQALESDNEGVIDLRVHEILIIDVIDLLSLHDFVFVQKFESHIFPSLLVLGHLHFPKAPLAEDAADLVVF